MEKTYQKLNQIKIPQRLRRLMNGVCLTLAVLTLSFSEAAALNLISDEETELFLADIIKPIFKSAGVPFNRNNIFIVNDNSLNAFVSDGNYLFINTGTIINAGSEDEIAGVLAHETGHIMGGHILRQKLKNQALQQASLASMILAGTAAAATGRGDVAMAIALGGQSSTLNNFMQYRTEQERSADESAVKLMNASGQSPAGLLKFMKRLAKLNEMSGIEESPYFRTHPVTRERISFLEKAVKESSEKSSSALSEQFKRIKAKLSAYLDSPKETFRRYPLSDTSAAAQYAHSIAYLKSPDIAKATAIINGLTEKEPRNPFFKELKAQIFFESGKIKDAKNEYRKALALLPNSAQIQVSLAQAILEDSPSPTELKEAINLLNKANISQPTAMAWMLLARAYGEQGNSAYSNYAAAEYSLRTGNIEVAKKQAENSRVNGAGNRSLQLKLDDLLNRIRTQEKDK